ncbi:hypothetical protein WR25_20057 [Diploscapter pachys]|uniref:BAG domain-containing protein n=1 Tax=Diploscapter pachys TaxID=2018661 RepID=A0A2A2LU81_9BILA|nr:hypothetical protein WR25_20057 [Diploscapter pachys]
MCKFRVVRGSMHWSVSFFSSMFTVAVAELQSVCEEPNRMLIVVAVGSKAFPMEILGEGDDAINTLGAFRRKIAEQAEIGQENMKIIHRASFPGKTLTGADDKKLEDFGFKENDKCIVIGQKVKGALKDDPGFAMLVDYEKKFLTVLQKVLDEIDVDLTELEKNFLDAEKSKEMSKRMDIRLCNFTEVSMRHLETIDGMNINTEGTSEEQATRNREKRKGLITGIQRLLDRNDTYVRRLEEYDKKLAGEIIE